MFFLAIVPRSTVILFIWACSSSSFLFHYLTCEILFSFSNNDNFSNNKNSNNVAVLLRYISFISSDLFSFAAISCQPLPLTPFFPLHVAPVKTFVFSNFHDIKSIHMGNVFCKRHSSVYFDSAVYL